MHPRAPFSQSCAPAHPVHSVHISAPVHSAQRIRAQTIRAPARCSLNLSIAQLPAHARAQLRRRLREAPSIQCCHRAREAQFNAAVARARPRQFRRRSREAPSVPPSLARGPVSSAVACARPRLLYTPSLARGPVTLARNARRQVYSKSELQENVSAALTLAVIRLLLQAVQARRATEQQDPAAAAPGVRNRAQHAEAQRSRF